MAGAIGFVAGGAFLWLTTTAFATLLARWVGPDMDGDLALLLLILAVPFAAAGGMFTAYGWAARRTCQEGDPPDGASDGGTPRSIPGVEAQAVGMAVLGITSLGMLLVIAMFRAPPAHAAWFLATIFFVTPLVVLLAVRRWMARVRRRFDVPR